jgi:hypothetical protein
LSENARTSLACTKQRQQKNATLENHENLRKLVLLG